MNMNNKIVKKSMNFILISALIMIFSVCLVYSADSTISLTAPASSGVVTGVYNFTATVTFGDDDYNISNCTFATTDDGVFATSVLGNITTQWNVTDSSALTETASTTVTVTCYNRSDGDSISDTSTSVVIDNADPTCAFTTDPASNLVEYMDAIGLVVTSTSTDSSTLTYSWVLWDANKNSQDTSTSSSNTFESEDFDELGDFTLGLTVTDQVSKSADCTNVTISVKDKDDDSGQIIAGTVGVGGLNKTVMIIIGILLLLVIAAGVGYFIIYSMKKK